MLFFIGKLRYIKFPVCGSVFICFTYNFIRLQKQKDGIQPSIAFKIILRFYCRCFRQNQHCRES